MQLSTLTLLEDVRRPAEGMLGLPPGDARRNLQEGACFRAAIERLLEVVGSALGRLAQRDPAVLAQIPQHQLFIDLAARLAPLSTPVPADELRTVLDEHLPRVLAEVKRLLAEGERNPEAPPSGQIIAPIVAARAGQLADLCRRYHVRRLEVFGSATTERFDPQRSDIDLLVEFDDVARGERFDTYFGFQEALERLFGRNVGLVEPDAIKNRYFRQAINQQRMLLYAA